MALADELEQDPVIRASLEGVDRTLLRKNLSLSEVERAAGRPKDLEVVAELIALRRS